MINPFKKRVKGALYFMIDRIIQIQNLGRFTNYQAHGDVAMRKLTLIYGENGHGKTTLCVLLCSLMTSYTPPLQARQTLGQANQPAAKILSNGQIHKLQNGTWTVPLPEVSIFDSDFVHQNIYSGDHIEVDHRRNSYRVIIGEQGVRLAQQIDQCNADIRDVNSNIRHLRDKVQRYIEDGTSIEWRYINEYQLRSINLDFLFSLAERMSCLIG